MRGRSGLLALAAAATLVWSCGLQVSGYDAAGGGAGGGGGDAAAGGRDGATSSPGDDASTQDDGAALGKDAKTPVSTVVYPMTSGTLYAFDVVSHLLKKLGGFSGCAGGQIRDIAVDASGAIFGIASAGLYRIGGDGACSDLTLFDASNKTHAASFPPAGESGIFVFQDGKSDLFRVALSGGGQATVQANALPDDGGSDLVCSTSICWALVDSNKSSCSSDSTDCIFKFRADGTGGTLVGSIAGGHKDVNGLAYVGGNLYGFCGNGDILEMPAASPGLAAPITPVLDATVPAVPGWQGGGSTSAEP